MGIRHGTTRREFLIGGAAAVAGVGCAQVSDDPAAADAGGPDSGAPGVADGAAPDPDAVPLPVAPPESTPESEMFPLGVSSGDVTPERAVLWTRYQAGAPLWLGVWEMSGDSYTKTVFDAEVSVGDGGYVHLDVDGLSAGRRYRYAFFEMDGPDRMARSAVGRFRAALAPDALEPLVIGACCCTWNVLPKDTLLRAGERDDLDVFLLTGDTTYNDSADSVSEYRDSWAQSLGSDGYRAMRSATSVLATWDDHEFDNDWNPEEFDPVSRGNAVQTFFENLPLRRDAADPDRVWKRLRWGRTADIFVLDCRSERLPSTRGEADATYVSRAQMDWLKAELSSSDAVFKVIVNTVPITSFPPTFFVPGSKDRWQGYAPQREELLRHITDAGITGTLFVTGDFHFGAMGKVSASGLGAGLTELMVGPGAQVINPFAAGLGAPQFDSVVQDNSFAVLHFDPDARTVRSVYVGAAGEELASNEYSL